MPRIPQFFADIFKYPLNILDMYFKKVVLRTVLSPWHIWCVVVFDGSSPLSLATPCVSFTFKTSPLMQFERTFHCCRWRLSGERSDLLLNRTPGTGRSPEVHSLKQRDPGARQPGAKERGPALASGLGFSLVSPFPLSFGHKGLPYLPVKRI